MSNNPLKVKLFAPSFIRSLSLLLAAIIHLACFIAVLINNEILALLPGGIAPWRIFFALYCGVATGVVGLAVNQLRNFFATFDEQYKKQKDLEGYETVQRSINAYRDQGEVGESGDTYNAICESNSWKSTDSGQ
jgi:hypothetical protein